MRLLTTALVLASFFPLAGAAQKPRPVKTPCTAPEYRQFDFWIGDWAVETQPGQLAGHSLISNEQNGCVIIEHWVGLGGITTGTSLNYWDVRDKKWHQLYISNSGNNGSFPEMAGAFKDGKMILLSDEKQSPVYRWTWYVMSPGHVKQMAEQSTDHQKTWTTFWDSVYIAKSGQSGK